MLKFVPGSPVKANALAHVHEVRRCEQPCAVASMPQDALDHGAGRALCEVHQRQGVDICRRASVKSVKSSSGLYNASTDQCLPSPHLAFGAGYMYHLQLVNSIIKVQPLHECATASAGSILSQPGISAAALSTYLAAWHRLKRCAQWIRSCSPRETRACPHRHAATFRHASACCQRSGCQVQPAPSRTGPLDTCWLPPAATKACFAVGHHQQQAWRHMHHPHDVLPHDAERQFILLSAHLSAAAC